MNIYNIRVDRFTVLDELTIKQCKCARTVFKVLSSYKFRFSVFDATKNMTIAKTMQWLEDKSGWCKRTEVQPGYPWIQLEITPEGEKILKQEINRKCTHPNS